MRIGRSSWLPAQRPGIGFMLSPYREPVMRSVTGTGLDGCEAFCEMIPHALGLQRLAPEDFLALDLPSENSEGLFANASLLHVPSRYLKAVLAGLFATLVPGGVLFSSNPRGNGQEGWMDERYGVHHDMGCPRV